MPNLKRIPSNSDLNNQDKKRAATPRTGNPPVRQLSDTQSFMDNAFQEMLASQVSADLSPKERLEKAQLIKEILNDNEPTPLNTLPTPLEDYNELQTIFAEPRGLVADLEDAGKINVYNTFIETAQIQSEIWKMLTKDIQQGSSSLTGEAQQKLKNQRNKIGALKQQYPHLKNIIQLNINKLNKKNETLLQLRNVKQLFITIDALQTETHAMLTKDIQQGSSSLTDEARQELYQKLNNKFSEINVLIQQYPHLKIEIQPRIDAIRIRGNQLIELEQTRESVLFAMRMYHAQTQNSQP